MSSLRDTMAAHGFESNDDYDFQVRCLLQDRGQGLRTLSIAGDGERRKTAFANALAAALDYQQVLYHDFSATTPPPPEVLLPESEDEYGRKEPPIDPLDDVVSKACALSEAEATVLILDQLQYAPYREQIRVYRLVRDRRWLVREAPYYANRANLLLFLISEELLYHALQAHSLRVWVGRVSERRRVFRPAEFGLGSDALPLFSALAALFQQLDVAPTGREFSRLLDDLLNHVHTEAELGHALFGRCEGIDRERLLQGDLTATLSQVIDHLRAYLGSEQIVLEGDGAAAFDAGTS